MKIAWIGTGVMGRPMVKHLADEDYTITVYNRTREKAQNIHQSIRVADTLIDALTDADIIITLLGFPSDVEQVYQTIFSVAKPGTLCMDMTTSSPTLAKKLYLEGQKKNIHCIDAPVTGGELGAIHQNLSIMVGADAPDFQKIKPLLHHLGKRIEHMGPASSGQMMKLCNQIVIASNLLGIAEALVFAKHNNIDPNKALSIITSGSAASWQAQNNGPKMIQKDYRPGFYVKHFLKDLKLALEHAKNVPLFITQKAVDLYQILSDNHMQDLGTQSIIEGYLMNFFNPLDK